MTFYIAVCNDTKVPKIFQEHERDELEKFAQENEYAYTYYEVEVGHIIEIPDVELFRFNI